MIQKEKCCKEKSRATAWRGHSGECVNIDRRDSAQAAGQGEEEGERCWQKVLGGIVPGSSSLFCATLTSRLERQSGL